MICRCVESLEPVEQRLWFIVQKGPRPKVHCRVCNAVWRARGAYIKNLININEDRYEYLISPKTPRKALQRRWYDWLDEKLSEAEARLKKTDAMIKEIQKNAKRARANRLY